MDGLTTVFTATAPVNVGALNRIKLAIADAGDHFLDSNVFLQCGSFSVLPTSTPGGTAPTATPTQGTSVPAWQSLFAPPATATPDPTATPQLDKDPEPRPLTEEQKQQLQRTDNSSLDDTHTEGDVISVRPYMTPPEITIANIDGLVVLHCHEDAEDICQKAKPGQYFIGKGEKNNEFNYDVYQGRVKNPHYEAKP
jgi:hypothetical protein